MRRGFTGRHMAASMVGFFTVVIAVNVTMATVASHSFGGTVVDNSYVASQRFNRWL
ncbi:MAG: FixH family protein, partial [Alphaproteobacteria bacterium]